VRFEFAGAPGALYTCETSTNLRTWTPLAVRSATADGLVVVPITISPAEPARFYRLR
jgi:hypothetical protein